MKNRLIAIVRICKGSKYKLDHRELISKRRVARNIRILKIKLLTIVAF